MTHWPGERSVTDSAPVAAPARSPWVTRRELLAGVGVVAVLAVVAVPLGVLWQALCAHGTGYVVGAHTVIPGESEAFVAADGWFAVLTGAVGILAALLAWTRPRWRGPTMLAALTVGGLLGALITATVGRTVAGGHASGPVNTLVTLPIEVRAHGLLFVEPLAAVAVTCLFAVFARDDNLDRSAPMPTTPVVASADAP